jgi:cytochrome c biogenesis factor
MNEWSSVIIGACTLFAGLVSTLLTVRMSRKSSREQNLISGDNYLVNQYNALLDQVQEERTNKETELKAVWAEIAATKQREVERADLQKRRDAGIRRYIADLHRHIYQQLPPPPPPYPDE